MKSSGQALRGSGPGREGWGDYSLYLAWSLLPCQPGCAVNTLPCAKASDLTFKKTPVLIKQALFHCSWLCSGSRAQFLCPAGVGRDRGWAGSLGGWSEAGDPCFWEGSVLHTWWCQRVFALVSERLLVLWASPSQRSHSRM